MTKFAHVSLNELLDDLAESRADMFTHIKLGFKEEYERVNVNRRIIETIVKELEDRGEEVPPSRYPNIP